MNTALGVTITQGETDLLFTKKLHAPQELVFTMFAEAEHVKQWWGPEDWTMPFCSIDFRPGGEWRYCIRNSEGEEHWSRAVYRNIISPELISFTDQFITAAGDEIKGMPSKQVTITLDQEAETTNLQVRIQLKSAAELKQLIDMGFGRGFPETLNHLSEHLYQSIKQEKDL